MTNHPRPLMNGPRRREVRRYQAPHHQHQLLVLSCDSNRAFPGACATIAVGAAPALTDSIRIRPGLHLMHPYAVSLLSAEKVMADTIYQYSITIEEEAKIGQLITDGVIRLDEDTTRT